MRLKCFCACSELQGVEFRLDVVQEPHLFVIGKWRRQTPDLAAALMYYYVLDGSVYQTPTIHAALSARLVRLHACHAGEP